MPTLNIDITAITDNGDGTGTGTYDKTGGPGTVDTVTGDINIKGQNTDIAWTVTVAGYTFASPGYSAPKIEQFGAPSNDAANTTCTIGDTNPELEFKYTLYLKNSAGVAIDLDPRVINR